MNIQQIKLLMEINSLRQLQNFNTTSISENTTSNFSTLLQQILLNQSSSSSSSETTSNTLNQLWSMSNINQTTTTMNTVNVTDEEIQAIIDEAAETYQLPASLLTAVIKQESNFNTNAVSSAGARGLMQLMPATAKSLGVENLNDPKENVMAGAKYLRQMLDQFGTVELALAAYNAGPGNVNKYGGIPPFKETQNYVTNIMNTLYA